MPVLLARPVTDATRRQFLALLGAVGLLAACATPESDERADAPVMRTAATPRGPVTVPAGTRNRTRS